MASRRSLSPDVLNRTVLARQLLLERRSLSLAAALGRVAGLQAQYAPSAYIGLWSRVRGFRRDSLTRALERRSVVQGTLMRSTIHVVSTRDYPLFAAAVREARRRWWQRTGEGRGTDVPAAEAAALTDDLLANGPMRRRDLVAELVRSGMPKETFEGVGLFVDLVRVPPSGTWDRRRADLYQTADRWIAPAPVPTEVAQVHLVRRYLAAFGPATPRDIASWSGLELDDVTETLGRMSVRNFEGRDGAELVDVARLPLVDGDAAAPVRFLGPWEAILLVHARRSGVLPEEYRPLVFSTKNPHSVGTFLVDGRVAGSWRIAGGEVAVEPFAPLPRRFERELEEERRALSAFIA